MQKAWDGMLQERKIYVKSFLLSLNINLFMELFQDDWFKTLNDKETKAKNCHHEKLKIA